MPEEKDRFLVSSFTFISGMAAAHTLSLFVNLGNKVVISANAVLSLTLLVFAHTDWLDFQTPFDEAPSVTATKATSDDSKDTEQKINKTVSSPLDSSDSVTGGEGSTIPASSFEKEGSSLDRVENITSSKTTPKAPEPSKTSGKAHKSKPSCKAQTKPSHFGKNCKKRSRKSRSKKSSKRGSTGKSETTSVPRRLPLPIYDTSSAIYKDLKCCLSPLGYYYVRPCPGYTVCEDCITAAINSDEKKFAHVHSGVHMPPIPEIEEPAPFDVMYRPLCQTTGSFPGPDCQSTDTWYHNKSCTPPCVVNFFDPVPARYKQPLPSYELEGSTNDLLEYTLRTKENLNRIMLPITPPRSASTTPPVTSEAGAVDQSFKDVAESVSRCVEDDHDENIIAKGMGLLSDIDLLLMQSADIFQQGSQENSDHDQPVSETDSENEVPYEETNHMEIGVTDSAVETHRNEDHIRDYGSILSFDSDTESLIDVCVGSETRQNRGQAYSPEFVYTMIDSLPTDDDLESI